MDRSDNTKPPPTPLPPSGTSAAGAATGTGDAFDLWLQRGLHQLYDSVANEPIPAELLRLIEADKSKRGS